MNMLKFGWIDIMVFDWCFGIMIYGIYILDDDVYCQIDMCLDVGINFIDCVEMYLVNLVLKEIVGMSEDVFGWWFVKMGCWDEVVLVIKVLGVGNVKCGEQGYDSKIVKVVVEELLCWMQIDYIDFY